MRTSTYRHKKNYSIDTKALRPSIDGVVCPPNISETVAVRTVKLAQRPRIASTTIKFISKPILLSILKLYLKKFSQSALTQIANRRRQPIIIELYDSCWNRRLLRVSALCFTMKPHVPLGQFPKPITQSLLIVLKTSLLYTRCLRAVNVTCIKYKVGLLQTAHSRRSFVWYARGSESSFRNN